MSTKQNVSPVTAGIAIVVFLLIAAFVYMKTGAPSVATPEQRAALVRGPEGFFAQKAKECGGDFSRLSAQDQQQIQAMTGGKGAETILQAYQKK